MTGALLHLGADRYVLDACVRHEVETVAVCGLAPWSGGVTVPEEIRVVLASSHDDVEAVLCGLARHGLADRRYEGVQTSYETALIPAALLGKALGTRCINPVAAARFRDKGLQKAAIAAEGLRATPYEVITDVLDVGALTYPFTGPSVLKPISGAGTSQTSIITSAHELRQAAQRMQTAQLASPTFILEEFVDGEEWFADGVAFDGEVLFFALGRYRQPCLAMVTAKSMLTYERMCPVTDGWAYESADDFVHAVIKSMNFDHGVFHLEFFRSPEDGALTFGEFNARRGGGMVQEDILAKFNVDLAECAMMCAIGERPRLDVRIRESAVGCTFLHAGEGTIISSPHFDEIMSRPNVEFARVYRPNGAILPSVDGSTPQLATAMLIAASAEELNRRLDELQEWYTGELVIAPAKATIGELRQWHQSRWPGPGFGDNVRYRP